MRPGFIYAFWSDTCPHIKIGRTTTSPAQRLAEVNGDPAYRDFGPWHLLACQQVADCFQIETALHRFLHAHRAAVGTPANELFAISRAEALLQLERIPVSDLLEPVALGRLEVDPPFMAYLAALFETTGLELFLDQQESWVFTLFPATGGGRSFTLSIDRHEVAFSTLPAAGDASQQPLPIHCLVVDSLVQGDQDFITWLNARDGWLEATPYASAMSDSIVVVIPATFEDTLGLFAQPGFRRALIAYWFDALLRMRQKGSRSLHAKRHNYSAITALMQNLRERRRFRLAHQATAKR